MAKWSPEARVAVVGWSLGSTAQPVREATKSRAGERTLHLPSWATAMLEQWFVANLRFDAPVFPNANGGFGDPWNTRRQLRQARGSEGFAWVTSHNFRRTAATILDEAGLTAREIADQPGHVRPSMTQDVYLGRKATNTRAVAALENIFESLPTRDESGG